MLPKNTCIWNLLASFFPQHHPRCSGKKSKFSSNSYPNPRWCPLLKDPAWRTLCRNKQVPVWCALPSLWWDAGLAKPSTTSSCKLPNRAHHSSGSSMVPCTSQPKNSPFLPHLHTLTASQCCYWHGMNWSETQQIYTVAEGRKTPCLKHM